MIFLRSLLFSITMMLATFLYSFLCLLIRPCTRPFRYRMITRWMRFMLGAAKLICGIDYRIDGMENIQTQNGLIFSKHQSTWETFLLPTLFHQPTIILKKELLKIPFFGWGLALLDPIAIDRKKSASSMQQILEQGHDRLKSDHNVLVFPEGTRTQPGERVKYKIGGAKLAEATGYSITPVAHNAGSFWPKRGFLKTAGTIQVVIGPPILTTDKTAAAILKEVEDWIESTVSCINENQSE